MFTSRTLLLPAHLIILSSSATVNSAIIGDKRHKISCGGNLHKIVLNDINRQNIDDSLTQGFGCWGCGLVGWL